MLSATDPNSNTTTYGFDAMGRSTTETFAGGHSVQYGYDANSNMVLRTDQNGTVVAYHHDLRNDVTRKSFTVTASHIKGETSEKLFWYGAANKAA